jgi:hypothetical protein
MSNKTKRCYYAQHDDEEEEEVRPGNHCAKRCNGIARVLVETLSVRVWEGRSGGSVHIDDKLCMESDSKFETRREVDAFVQGVISAARFAGVRVELRISVLSKSGEVSHLKRVFE